MTLSLLKRLKNLTFNDDNREIFSAAFVILIVKVMFAFTGFLLSVVITRQLNTTDAGAYFFMLSVVALLSVVGRAGVDNAIVRFVAIAKKQISPIKIKLIILLSTRLTLAVSMTISLLLWCFSQYGYSSVFENNHYLKSLLWAVVIIPISSVYFIYVQGFQGLKKIKSFAVFNGVVRIINLMALLILIVCFSSFTLEQAFLMYFISSLISLLVIIVAWIKQSKQANSNNIALSATEYSTGNIEKYKSEFYQSSFSLWGTACLAIIMGQGAQVLLGFFCDAEQVAYFAVANRVAMLVSFVLLAINGILSPKFAEISVDDDIDRLRKIYQSSRLLMIVVASPVLVVGFIFAEDILLLFGQQYQKASLVLQILIAAQFVKVIVGSVGQLLIMTGSEGRQRKNLFIAVATLLILSIVLMPTYGALGAGIATFTAITINNGLGILSVIRKLNIRLI